MLGVDPFFGIRLSRFPTILGLLSFFVFCFLMNIKFCRTSPQPSAGSAMTQTLFVPDVANSDPVSVSHATSYRFLSFQRISFLINLFYCFTIFGFSGGSCCLSHLHPYIALGLLHSCFFFTFLRQKLRSHPYFLIESFNCTICL